MKARLRKGQTQRERKRERERDGKIDREMTEEAVRADRVEAKYSSQSWFAFGKRG